MNERDEPDAFDRYQIEAMKTAMFSHSYYPLASLMIEAAELADLFTKPLLRGDNKRIRRDNVVSEAGDVLWNLTATLEGEGIALTEVAAYNIEKLRRRQADGTIMGDGDR